eukprot:CAMPEP_0205937498 /NCGR_PEP_ID=MMETSP1325-20131115/44304_1 /ASSEMBLY_ACC=CAM_ASM_000708 /TAXON_ID=236786 /ORGANISM="Florenciella sp., Strain RCC1007" /LENGTH=46 /DNA_ID= /DNA_START= /DNA_END= /DNA_ORIENTATION=
MTADPGLDPRPWASVDDLDFGASREQAPMGMGRSMPKLICDLPTAR